MSGRLASRSIGKLPPTTSHENDKAEHQLNRRVEMRKAFLRPVAA
jgi:hypothetical protein